MSFEENWDDDCSEYLDTTSSERSIPAIQGQNESVSINCFLRMNFFALM